MAAANRSAWWRMGMKAKPGSPWSTPPSRSPTPAWKEPSWPHGSRHQHRSRFLSRRWIVWFGLVGGLFVSLPFLAPILMQIGWKFPANAIYFIYSFLCHQLPERSYFLFGPKLTYSLAEVQNAWQTTPNPLVLRQFVGNAQMGWKVAWSRSDGFAVYQYLVIRPDLVAGTPRVRNVPWWVLGLFLLPMAVDGGTHFLSDLAGIGKGFRDSNVWLAVLTHHTLTPAFYAGDAWGSFNSLMRLLTGLLFGLGLVWFGFPYLDQAFCGAADPPLTENG